MPFPATLDRGALYAGRGSEAEATRAVASVAPVWRGLRFLLALAPVPVTLAFQLAFWDLAIRPFGLFFFVQAIYVSAWLGGLYAGALSTIASAVLIYYYFLPPERSWAVFEPKHLVMLGLFVTLGMVASVAHERFKRTTRALRASVADGAEKNDLLLRANEEVRRLYEKTKGLDDLKTRLFAGVSHELRTPLSVVIGSAERLVAQAGTEATTRRDAEVLGCNARMLLHYVDDLTEVVKLEAGAVQPEYAELDVAQHVRAVACQLEDAARAKGIAYVVELPTSLEAQVDWNGLRRVVVNLLSNALKFTPEGGRVRLALKSDDARDRIQLEVGDSGPGIPRERRDVVFDAYVAHQDDGGSRRLARTGLGLAIARALVELNGGSIGVSDAPEGGALFLVELPRTAPAGATVTPRSQGPRPGPLGPELRSLVEEVGPSRTDGAVVSGRPGAPVVLVVEDNHDLSDAICDVLRADYQVAAAFDGREGLERARELGPDLVITDVMMPEMSGEQLVHELHASADLATTPIIVLTAVADDRARLRLLREGARDYVTKPFRAEELLARVASAVAQRRADREIRTLTAQLEAVSDASISVSEAVATLPRESVEAVLRTIARQAQVLTGAELVAVGLGTDPEKPFDPWVFAGVSAEQEAAIGRHPRPVGLLGVVARADRPVRIPDVRLHPAHLGVPAGHPPVTSFLGVPIRYRDRVEGYLYMGNKCGGVEFSDADERVVEMLAARAGVAMETAHLYATEGTERAWLDSVIDQLPDAVVLLDAAGRITKLNRAAAALRGRDDGRRDPFGNPIPLELRRPSGELVAAEDIPYVRAFGRGEPVIAENLVIRRDSWVVPVLASAVSIRGPEGKATGATAVFRDCSAQKEMERMREEWSAVIAHDLRQPVGVIAIAAELASRSHEGPLGVREAKHLERIKVATRRLREMIDELLDVTQLESRRLVLAPEEIDVARTAREVCERMGVLASGHVVSVNETGESSVAWADPARVEQVLTNLVSNACKYGARDTKIEVDVESDEHDIEVTVTNEGPGISAEERPKLFQRFTRSHDGRAAGVSGIGLGLYICKGLVEAHGGRIWVESTPGKTTSFHFTLPRRAA